MKLSVINSHPLIETNDGLVLLDTGSPMSFHTAGSLTINEDSHPCGTSIPGVTAEYLSQSIGLAIEGLLGMDIISRYENILIDYQGKSVSFNQALQGMQYNVLTVMGIRVIDLPINGENIKMFVDTGAQVSYLPKEITNGYPSIGNVIDFYPQFGEFSTNIYPIPVEVNNQTIEVKFGNLPQALSLPLKMIGIEGIIGYDLFSNFKVSIATNSVIVG